jgi:hypothetical protein
MPWLHSRVAGSLFVLCGLASSLSGILRAAPFVSGPEILSFAVSLGVSLGKRKESWDTRRLGAPPCAPR